MFDLRTKPENIKQVLNVQQKATEISLHFPEGLKRFLAKSNGKVGFRIPVTVYTTEVMGHMSIQQHITQRLM